MENSKTDKQIIKPLFQGGMKYLNLINYNFSRAFDLFGFINHSIIKLVVSYLVSLSQDPTHLSQILVF